MSQAKNPITNSQTITLGKHHTTWSTRFPMPEDPVKSLIEELGTHLSQRVHSDVVLNNGKGRQFPIKPSEFSEIKLVDAPRRIAFVDGGDGILEESPNYLITINRVYYSIFQGKKRIKPKSNPRIQFFSYVTSNISESDGAKQVIYDTKLFAHSVDDKRFLPSESDLSSYTERASVLQGAKLNSLGRKFAEWKLATNVVESELNPGDVLVMDGSLQTTFKNESKYAKKLYDTALEKDVIVCGLAKTSRLITESGAPLLARIAEISEDVAHPRWYVRVAEEVSRYDEGFMLAVKFHPKSRFVFRFEILREQFKNMSSDDLNSVLGSLAENSQDVAMVGYPYGAIDADRFAQVRLDELNMYKGFILSEMLKRPEWKRLQKYGASLGAHDVLNGVTG